MPRSRPRSRRLDQTPSVVELRSRQQRTRQRPERADLTSRIPRSAPGAQLTRRIGEVCTDYSTTRRELVMGSPGLMVRRDGICELSDMGLSVWRVERFLKDGDPAQREP